MPSAGHLYYEEVGSGPALVLLHGHTLDHRMWRDHLEALAARYRVITPDLAGHGRSGLSPDGAPHADDLAALLNHLSIERAALCGFSMGGAVAVSFGLHHPGRTAALLLVDAILYGLPFTEWNGSVPYIKQARREGLAPALEAWLADPLFAPAMAGPAGEQIGSIVREYPGTEWLTRPAYSPYPPGPLAEADRLGEIAAPCLVLVGERDLPDFHRIADRLAGQIPRARKCVIPGAGHMLPLEAPEPFRAQLCSFLYETFGA